MPDEAPSRWIISPAVDLCCISGGWAVFFLLPAVWPDCERPMWDIALAFFVSHRYFTFPLVYLDRAEFRRRRFTYLLVPVVCLGGVWMCYYFQIDEPEMRTFWWFFNYFHFVRQKYGILRIYSGKARRGAKPLDEVVTYGWGAAGIVTMLVTQADVEGRLIHYVSSQPVWIYAIVVLVAAWWAIDELGAGGGRSRWTVLGVATGFVVTGLSFGTMVARQTASPLLAYGLYGVLGVATVVWLVHELRAPGGLSWPRALFAASVMVMYGIGPVISPQAVQIATSFSHASEYIALAALAVRNKARSREADAPLLVAASRHVVPYTLAFMGVVYGVLQSVKAVSLPLYLMFTYGTSFAHFVFDGMIWKLRRPKVAREVGA